MTQNKLLELWLKKLTSGDYAQTQGCLHDGDGYCCLGVLCEAYIELGGKLKVVEREDGGYCKYDDQEEILPEKVCKAVGLRTPKGDYGDHNLADENDKGIKFEEIAAIIKSKPAGLFKAKKE